MLLIPPTADGLSIVDGWCRYGWREGRDVAFEAAIAGSRVLWCTHLAERYCCGIEGFAGRVFVNKGTAALDIFRDAMLNAVCLQVCGIAGL